MLLIEALIQLNLLNVMAKRRRVTGYIVKFS